MKRYEELGCDDEGCRGYCEGTCPTALGHSTDFYLRDFKPLDDKRLTDKKSLYKAPAAYTSENSFGKAKYVILNMSYEYVNEKVQLMKYPKTDVIIDSRTGGYGVKTCTEETNVIEVIF